MPHATTTFQPFSHTHAMVVICYAVAALLLIVLGRFGRRRESLESGQNVHFLWLGFVTIVQLVNVVFWCVPPQLDPASSLPLHICDLVGLITIIALATESRWARVLVFYWGIGLSSQAFITPVITDGTDTMRFHMFFLSHFTIIATGLYDLFVRRFRPSWIDCAMAIIYTVLYGGIVLPINLLAHWNYGYIGNIKPANPTLIDRLGDWPIRLVYMFVIVVSGYLILTAIATALEAIASRKSNQRTLRTSGGDRQRK